MQINILKLDETSYWREDIQAMAGRLFGIYLYNPAVGVHCCELTPSYELHYMGEAITSSLSENDLEALAELLREALADSDDVKYMHCAAVNRQPALANRSVLAVGWAVFGDFGDEGDTPEECMEAATEYLRGNGFTDT